MDHEQRTQAATKQDSKLAGRIIRSLRQVEDDYYLASITYSEMLMAAAVAALKKAVPEPFKVVESDISAAIYVAGWRATRGVGQDFSLELAELCVEEDREYTWLSAVTAVGPTRLGLELVSRPGLREAMRAITKEEKNLGELWKAGFLLDKTDARLFLPIVIPPEKLAQAFEQNSLNETMALVTKAVEQAISAMPELDKIIEAVRIAAKVTK